MKRNRSFFDKYFLFVEAPVSTSTRRMTDDRVWVPSLPPPRPMGPCRKVPSRKEGTVKCLFEFSPGLLLEIRAGNLSILREQETFGNFSGKRAPFHRKFHHPSAASLFSFLSLFFLFFFSSRKFVRGNEGRRKMIDRSSSSQNLYYSFSYKDQTFYLPSRRCRFVYPFLS